MASSVYHTIALQGGAVRIEGEANEAITPGELLSIDNDEEFIPHGSAEGTLPGKLIALESPTAAPGSSAAIDTDYATGDIVYAGVGQPGEVYYMFLKAGETVVKGQTALVSDGAGALQPETVDAGTLAGSIVGIAEEDLTAGIARARVKVRIT